MSETSTIPAGWYSCSLCGNLHPVGGLCPVKHKIPASASGRPARDGETRDPLLSPDGVRAAWAVVDRHHGPYRRVPMVELLTAYLNAASADPLLRPPARDGETLSDDETRKMLDDWRDSMIEVVRLRQEVAALRAELADARVELKTVVDSVDDALFAMREPMTLGDARKGRAILTSYSVRRAIAAARAASGEDASHE